MTITIINNSVREFPKTNGHDSLDANGLLGLANCLTVNPDEGTSLHSFRTVRATGTSYKLSERKKTEKKKKKKKNLNCFGFFSSNIRDTKLVSMGFQSL